MDDPNESEWGHISPSSMPSSREPWRRSYYADRFWLIYQITSAIAVLGHGQDKHPTILDTHEYCAVLPQLCVDLKLVLSQDHPAPSCTSPFLTLDRLLAMSSCELQTTSNFDNFICWSMKWNT